MSRFEADGVAFVIREMRFTDIDACLQLSSLAGWNQLEADWARVLRSRSDGTTTPTERIDPAKRIDPTHELHVESTPDLPKAVVDGSSGCFVCVGQGRVIGTVSTIRYGCELGWIGMMLVEPQWRRRGIAGRLMSASISHLRSKGVRCIRLDATPLGHPVYQRLGFHDDDSFHRWRHPGDDAAPCRIEASGKLQSQDVLLDERAFGVRREPWLRQLDSEAITIHVNELGRGVSKQASPTKARSSQGFGMLRSGRIAAHLGPVVAEDETAAEKLVSDLVAQTTLPVFWDAPSHAESLARQFGFEPVRDVTRMTLDRPFGQPISPLQFAIASLESG